MLDRGRGGVEGGREREERGERKGRFVLDTCAYIPSHHVAEDCPPCCPCIVIQVLLKERLEHTHKYILILQACP